MDYRIWVVVLLVPVIIFSWIRNLDTLASLSGLANICILSGLLIIAYDEISKLIANGPHEAAVKEGQLKSTGPALRLAMFFGTAVFAYEAIGVVIIIIIIIIMLDWYVYSNNNNAVIYAARYVL